MSQTTDFRRSRAPDGALESVMPEVSARYGPIIQPVWYVYAAKSVKPAFVKFNPSDLRKTNSIFLLFSHRPFATKEVTKQKRRLRCQHSSANIGTMIQASIVQ